MDVVEYDTLSGESSHVNYNCLQIFWSWVCTRPAGWTLVFPASLAKPLSTMDLEKPTIFLMATCQLFLNQFFADTRLGVGPTSEFQASIGHIHSSQSVI
jgi:hypothetical protein